MGFGELYQFRYCLPPVWAAGVIFNYIVNSLSYNCLFTLTALTIVSVSRYI